jgi:YidC/Oxa1 family membrane protein insertase
MGMEKRAFYAFIISMILFLAYDYFYLAPKNKEHRARRMAQLAALDSAKADTVRAVRTEKEAQPSFVEAEKPVSPAVVDSDTAFVAVNPDSAGLISVVTPLYQITFSKAGGDIRSIQLFEYETEDLPVELLPQNLLGAGIAKLSLRGEDRELSLSQYRFEAFLSGVGGALPDGYRITMDAADTDIELVFRAVGVDGDAISRTYRFFGDSYQVEAKTRFSTASFPFARHVSWDFGLGMASTEKNKQDDYQNFQAIVSLGEETHKHKPSNFGDGKIETYPGMVNWTSLQTKYFTVALIPPKPLAGEVVITGNKQTHRITTRVTLPASDARGYGEQTVTLYLGPLDYGILKSFGVGLEKNINMGWKFFRPVSWVILWALIGLYKFIPNYGIVIILLSVFTKVLFYRLTHKSFKSMRDMQDLQPRLQALKEKYKDDKQKISQETMRLYKEAGVNPLGGCLPLLLQMPVFIALFSVLKFTIEVRGAHFFGWITDLSQQDVLTYLPMALPVIGREVSVLPLLMGAAMLLQTKVGGSMTPGSVSTQPKLFNYMLPIVFTVIFYKMPSGLVLYWFVNNILTIAQQYYINKDKDAGSKKDSEEDKNAKESNAPKPAKRLKSKQNKNEKTKESSKKGR